MQLSNFDTAWRQLKSSNAMQRVESKEILSIIGNVETADRTKLQRVIFNVVMFIVITISVHGG
jgi:hypothetical protein